jgi:hypothetical protein
MERLPIPRRHCLEDSERVMDRMIGGEPEADPNGTLTHPIRGHEGSYSNPSHVRRKAHLFKIGVIFRVELPEPYHLFRSNTGGKILRASRTSYATGAVRAWLRERHKIRLSNSRSASSRR